MKNAKLPYLGGIGLLSIAAFFLFKDQDTTRDSRRADAPLSRTAETKAQNSNLPKEKTNDPEILESKEMANSAIAAFTKEECLQAIHEASVTYDPAELPKINEFLKHADPEVRHAAVQGMIVLGDSKAAPYLRTAAKNAATPKEAVALEEAAEYMELPPAKHFKLRKMKSESK